MKKKYIFLYVKKYSDNFGDNFNSDNFIVIIL